MWGLNKNCLFLGLTLKTVSIRHTQEVLFELLIIMEVLGTTHYVRTDVNFELTDFGFSSRNPNCAAHSTVVHNGRNIQISSKNYDTICILNWNQFTQTHTTLTDNTLFN